MKRSLLYLTIITALICSACTSHKPKYVIGVSQCSEDIWRDWQRWHDIEQDERVGTTYDLYYCGIVLFDKQRYGHHYKVNF